MPESQKVPALLFLLERKFFVNPIPQLGEDEISIGGSSHYKVNEISSVVMEYMWTMKGERLKQTMAPDFAVRHPLPAGQDTEKGWGDRCEEINLSAYQEDGLSLCRRCGH